MGTIKEAMAGLFPNEILSTTWLVGAISSLGWLGTSSCLKGSSLFMRSEPDLVLRGRIKPHRGLIWFCRLNGLREGVSISPEVEAQRRHGVKRDGTIRKFDGIARIY
ncbi:hypothetical protein CRG98_006220 [Punica granatum]|uniref:Uncharacterized protein n=1 Tax=Punica granatum TaxID=22663 RepID=A0A2I0KXT7_PUNGR|nr:hypothetical protein CRG98_006220 [Punica granatum]